MAARGALETLLFELTRALRPLAEAAQEQPPGSGIARLAIEVGVEVGPVSLGDAANFATAVLRAYGDLRALMADPEGFADRIPEALNNVVALVTAIKDVAPAKPELSGRLFDYLGFTYVERNAPTLHQALMLVGVFTAQIIPEAGVIPEHLRRVVHWARIPRLLKPSEIFEELYGWGTTSLDSNLLLSRIDALIWSIGLPSRYAGGASPGVDGVLSVFVVLGADTGQPSFGAEVSYLAAAAGAQPGLAVVPKGMVSVNEKTSIGNAWQVGLDVSAETSSGYGISIRPGGEVTMSALAGQPAVTWKLTGDLGIARTAAQGSRNVLFGSPTGARLEAKSVGIELRVAASNQRDEGEVSIELVVADGKLVIAAEEGDGFLGNILPPEGVEVDFDFTLGWSAKRGLYFRGSGGLETTISVQLNLGPLRIETIYLRLRVRDDGRLGITVAASPSIDLSVVAATVDRIGIELAVELGTSPSLDVLFVPPSGVGVLVDAGVVVGGGYLSFDHPNGRYAGIVQLQIYAIALTAVGLLDTKLPGGQKGYSLLIIITAEFPPIQLGMGFTLNGAGGAAGIHRTVAVDALQAGVRSGSIANVLFPEDPIRDAPMIVSDLRTFFPPALNRYLFGPIALIGYGTPTLVTAELAIIIELPSPVRLILLGTIAARVPNPESPVVILNLDILGILDGEAKKLSVDASLRDSKIGAFTISGDMAMRLTWGDKPNFALAVGGWNPHFQPPAGFPELRRITVALGSGDNPRINLQGYMALTSSSFQVGARAELYAAKGGFNLNGHIGFDAICMFSPFSFRTDFSAGVAFRRDGKILASVHLDATLVGPSPFHAWGEASISLLFLEASVPFDATFGTTTTVQAPTRNPWELLEPAVRDPRNWTSEFLPGTRAVVALRKPSAESTLAIIDPAGSTTFRQKVVPLNFAIDKFGEATATGAGSYNLTTLDVAGAALPAAEWAVVQDMFARPQYRKMSDDEKLSGASYEPLDSGMRIVDQIACGASMDRSVEYETLIVDSMEGWQAGDRQASHKLVPKYPLPLAHQLAMVGAGAKMRSVLKNSGLVRFDAGLRDTQFKLTDELYDVVDTDTLVHQNAILRSPTTQGRAQDALNSYLAANPIDRDRYQVVPVHEAAV